MLVLIPKGNVYTAAVGSLEGVGGGDRYPDYNIISIPGCLAWVLFCAGRGKGTAIMDIKLAQYLESVDQDPLLLLLIDLSKSYNNLDWGILLQTLLGYGMGPKLRVLLAECLLGQELVSYQNGFYGPWLLEIKRTTNELLALPTIFNTSVYSVVRHWLSLTVEDDSATNDRLVMAVGRCMGVIYANYRMIRLMDTEWPQGAINVHYLQNVCWGRN